MVGFVKELDEYKRELDILPTARHDLAQYLSIMENIPFDEALKYVDKVTAKDGILALKNPTIHYLERQDNGDRVEKQWNLVDYLDTIGKNAFICAPNLTVYLPITIKKSILAEYIIENMQLRKADKKQMFICRMRLQEEAAAYFKSLQESRKVKNNSVSGMHGSPGTPFYNKSTHSTLTSSCRCATSYANSGNEKILGGLRHYYAPNIAISHILTSIRATDLVAIESLFDKLGIHRPTAEECLEACLMSTRQYWSNTQFENEIYELFIRMNDAQRAAWLYTGDLYFIDKYNSDFVRDFLTKLAQMKTGTHPNPSARINSLDDNYTAIASLLCAPIIGGMLLSDAEEKKPEAYHAVALTSENMERVCIQYKDFIQTFLRQNYLPGSIATFPTSIRNSVPTSDTDSTIFTTQHYVDKYGGDIPFSHEANSIQYVVTFLISGLTQNLLLMYSANLGVDKSQITVLEMKNEYIFPVYVLTSLAKHYFTLITAGEGNVYAENKRKLEIKGVQLRTSNAPPFVIEKAFAYMRWIIDSIMQNRTFNLSDVLDPVYELEKQIIDDIINGGSEFMTRARVNGPESYAQKELATPYKAHLFWNRYFSEKYGDAPEPPYRAVKIKVNLPNKTAMRNWLDNIQDITIRKGMEEWVLEESKTNVEVFRVPMANLAEHGIPKEILPIVNIKGIVSEVMKPFYIVLESLGIYMMNKQRTRILSDEYTPLKYKIAA